MSAIIIPFPGCELETETTPTDPHVDTRTGDFWHGLGVIMAKTWATGSSLDQCAVVEMIGSMLRLAVDTLPLSAVGPDTDANGLCSKDVAPDAPAPAPRLRRKSARLLTPAQEGQP